MGDYSVGQIVDDVAVPDKHCPHGNNDLVYIICQQ